LFTIPPYGKKFVKGVSGKVVTAVLHGLVFVAAARFFMLCKEGFQGTTLTSLLGGGNVCRNYGTPSADGNIRIYTQNECEGKLNGEWSQNGECAKREGGTYSWDCRHLNSATNEMICGNYGRPSADGTIRIYTQNECEEELNGVWSENGECAKRGGNTYSWDCRHLNSQSNFITSALSAVATTTSGTTTFEVVYNGTVAMTAAQKTSLQSALSAASRFGVNTRVAETPSTMPPWPGRTVKRWTINKANGTVAKLKSAVSAMSGPKIVFVGEPTLVT
jgi:hypothetical protein